MAEMQTIPARHGVATFVPAGQVIKIVNTSGTQVIDTWAFALPKPEGKKGEEKKEGEDNKKGEQHEKGKPKTPAKKGKKDDFNLPSQEDAEQATKQGLKQEDSKGSAAQKSTWSSYVPSIGWSSKKDGKDAKEETQQQKDSKTWASYFPSGKGFSSYIPKTASDSVSAFATSHYRDPNKSYMEQLQDFSKTPVGAAGLKAMSGSGYSGSLYAGYQAWNASNAANGAAMEFMSMAHSRVATLHLRPKVNDVLVSNVREPILTLLEDSSAGIHDTLIAACDPQRYQNLGVDKWEEHGSCAENLVLALKELNERAGLKGAKAVGAEVTINNVPAPLNLFQNVPWDEDGDLGFKAPKGKEGDFVRLKAERDVVVVMSACPQDVLEVNNKKPTDAHFIVEDMGQKEAIERSQVKKRPAPRKLNSFKAPSTVATGDLGDDDKSRIGSTPAKKAPVRRAPVKKPIPPPAAQSSAKKAAPAPIQQTQAKKPVPKPAAPKQESEATPPAANGTVERKKPRKLSVKAKPEQ